MKKVGIDARLYSQTGVGTYLKNFLHYLEESDTLDVVFYVYLLDKDFDKCDLPDKKFVKRRADFLWHSFSEQLGFLMMLYKDNLDLMHFTYFSYPILYFKKFIATVHDVTPLLFKTGRASTKNSLIYQIKHSVFKIILYTQVRLAKKIITPTDYVKEELVKIYGSILNNKIERIYEGVNWQLQVEKINGKLEKKYKDFFVYIGNFYPHKNVERLIRAFALVESKQNLILIGPDDFFAGRLKKIVARLRLTNVKFVDNPTISDLKFFYSKAKALVHPSLSEGFGLTLIEAAYCHCPIIASNIRVFREIFGDSYMSFNPENEKDIASKIKKYLKEGGKFNYENALSKCSFSRMTKETLKIYLDNL